jgi:hypothetical protein
MGDGEDGRVGAATGAACDLLGGSIEHLHGETGREACALDDAVAFRAQA